ncbi:MAG: hypothetical protein GY810_23460 [Aureispira sp.]|nr:hypothetical protein [Aureispira sp.]
MYKSGLIFIAIVGILLFFVACKNGMSEQEKFIQGKWSYSEQVDEGFSSHISWTFDKGSFEMDGYPPINVKGNYSVKRAKEDAITLELYSQTWDGEKQEDETLKIQIDKSNKTIKIRGRGPFTRSL